MMADREILLRRVTHFLLWAFALSWAFDFKADVAEGTEGGSLAQLVFLGLSLASGILCMLVNRHALLVRPGVWLLIVWWGFLGYITISSIVLGVPPGRFVRVVVPYVMIGLGLAVSHAGACRGLRPMQLVTPIVVAGTINVMWRVFYGFAFKGATLDTVRMEVFSPAMNPLFAYLGCAFFLRPRFHWLNVVVTGVALTGVFLSVTRGLIFPIVVSGILGCVFFVLGLLWRVFSVRQIPQKAIVFAGLIAMMVGSLAVAQLLSPVLLERWTERLFFSGRASTAVDLSWLTREAEATAMWKLLAADPVHLITGKGMGAEYHWDPSFWPELYTVFPADYDFSTSIWFNGHSVWTYTLFSGGAIGTLFHLALFAGICGLSLRAVRAQSGRHDPEVWVGFLPFFVVACLLSESITSNQFAERLTGVLLGLAGGIPQALFLRSLRRKMLVLPTAAVGGLAASGSAGNLSPMFRHA